MQLLARLSIRTNLGLVIGTLGSLLIAVTILEVVSAADRYTATDRVLALSRASQPLFQSLASGRSERGALVSGMMAEAPLDSADEAYLLDNRKIAEAAYKDAVRRLGAIDLPGLGPLVEKLRTTHDAFRGDLLIRADAAMHQVKSARDPAVTRDAPRVSQAWVDAVIATSEFVEAAVKLEDPLVDHFLSVKKAAATIRNYGGFATLFTRESAIMKKPWTLDESSTYDQYQGRVRLAWSMLQEIAARADTPRELRESIAQIEKDYIGYLNGDATSYANALRSGRLPEKSVGQMRTQALAALEPVVATADVALSQMIDRANGQMTSAKRSLALSTATLVVALCFTMAGFVIAFRRVSGPIRAIAVAMRRLAGRDMAVVIPGTGRADEIGEMAAAVVVFRDEMLRSEALAAQTAALQEAEAQRAAVEAQQQAAAQQAEVVGALAHGLEALAQGNLTVNLNAAFAPEYERLRTDFNAAVEGLQHALRDIMTHSQAIGSGTHEIATGADDLARRTEQQAASLQQTAAALDEVTATVRHTANGSARAQNIAVAAKTEVEDSAKVVAQTVAAMGEIEGSARQIGQIIGVIDEIALQTNLLALNAGVEAARAGEAGRGFAVVAQEVRALAQRAADAAKEIKALVTTSMQQVERGVSLVGATGAALERIQTGVTDINMAISEIAASAAEQATGLAEVNTAVNLMDQTTQQNAAMVEQSTAATHSLAHETEALNRAVERFRIDAVPPNNRRSRHTEAA
jgi:methyl-accepting chemotaxis protein